MCLELVGATLAAEIVGLPLVLLFPRSLLRQNLHATDGINNFYRGFGQGLRGGHVARFFGQQLSSWMLKIAQHPEIRFVWSLRLRRPGVASKHEEKPPREKEDGEAGRYTVGASGIVRKNSTLVGGPQRGVSKASGYSGRRQSVVQPNALQPKGYSHIVPHALGLRVAVLKLMRTSFLRDPVWLLTALLLLVGCGVSVTPPVVVTSPLSLDGATLAFAITGVAYGTTLQARGGSQPYTYALVGGTLPTGISFNTSGALSGRTYMTGTFPFVVSVSDANTPASTVVQSFTLIVAPPMALAGLVLPPGRSGSFYSAPLISGGLAPYTITLSSGALPGGLAFQSDGTVTGTPLSAQTGFFGAVIRDSSNRSASGSFTLVIKPVPILLPPNSPVTGAVGSPYARTFSAVGGTPPYIFSVAGGSLPDGLTLTPAGLLTGTFSAGGSFTPNLLVSDSAVPVQSAISPVPFTVFDSFVSVDMNAALVTVPPAALGIHTSVYDGSLSDVAALPALLGGAGITLLRYPGGSYADNYHWAQYTMTPEFVSTSPACGVSPNGFLAAHSDFGSFVKTLVATGTQAMITVNYGTSLADANGTVSTGSYGPGTCSEPNTGGQPLEAAAWVAYANGNPSSAQVLGIDAVGFDWKTVGFWASLRAGAPLTADDGYNFLRLGIAEPIGIRFWEIGNEVYYNGYNTNISVETDLHAPYVYSAGAGAAPDSRGGIAALSPTAYGTNAAAFIQAMRAVDPAISVGLVVGSAIDPVPQSWTAAALHAVCLSANIDFAILHYYPGTYNATTAAQMLSLPQADLPGLVSDLKQQLAVGCRSQPDPIEIFVTETNPNGFIASGTPDAVAGLFAAHVTLTSLEAGVANTDWLELHGGAGVFLAPVTEEPGPAYYGLQLAHLLASTGDVLVPTISSHPDLLVHAARKASGARTILLINAKANSSATVQVTVLGTSLPRTATLYSYGVGTSQSSGVLEGSAFALADTSFAVTVPAYTAVELVIP